MDYGRIKLLVMDVDGTLTDGKIYMGSDGEAMKAFDVKDGYAIAVMLPELGIKPVVISGRKSAIVERRCRELGICELHQGVSDKLAILNKVVARFGVSLCDVAYVGDDLNDFESMQAVLDGGGVVACPADAVDAIREICSFLAQSVGGNGAVREFIEHLGQKVEAVTVKVL